MELNSSDKKLTRKELAENTRATILSVAASEFAENGYHGARIEKLAKRAGFSMSSIYVHFKDKAALFDAVMAQAATLFTQNLNIRLEKQTDPKLRDFTAINAAISFAESHPGMFRIIMNPGRVEKGGRTIISQMIAQTRQAQYPRGKADGVFWQNFNETVAAVFETGVVFVVLDWWLDNPEKASRDEVLKTLVNLRRFGVEIPNTTTPDFLTDRDIMTFNTETKFNNE